MSVSFGPDGPIHGRPMVLAPSEARTASGQGTARPTEDESTARLTLDVTAASGDAPTLDVTIQTSPDGDAWTAVGTFPQATGIAQASGVFSGLDRYIRASWAIAATANPSFTFKVSGVLV